MPPLSGTTRNRTAFSSLERMHTGVGTRLGAADVDLERCGSALLVKRDTLG
jgi:hypothetical protein